MEGSNKNTEGIKVAIRMRPLNEREASGGQEKIFRCLTQYNAVSQIKDGQPLEGLTSYFDKVFDESAHNADVYSYIGKEIVQGVMAGINGTVFAYGQTSSGKTHTMLGGGEEKGVVYQAAEDIFAYIANHPNRDFLLRASFVEIYNENIRDLLSENPDATVSIREDPRKGVYCEAVEFVITDFDSILKLLKKGIARRVVEATAMNDTSSRSHTIFRLVVESRESARPGVEADGAVLVSALNLVDLAGSESVRHTGAMGQRAKEGGKINQSLLSLSRVIHSLSQPGAHVNFRDSKLTRLLQPSLCGNAKMAIVCCITAAQNYLEETRSTLAFASRAKLVVTHAKVNEVLDESSQIRRLKKELEVLKEAYLQASSLSPEEVARLQSEKADLEAQVSQLKEQMEVQRIVISELNSSTSSTSSDSDAETVPEELDIPRPKRKRSSASSMYSEDQENIPPSNESRTMFQEEMDRKNQLIENISSELAQARKEIESLKEELESSGTTVMLDREFDLMAEKSALEGERDRLCEEVNDLQTTVQKLKDELLEAKASNEPQEAAQLTELVLQMGAMEENLTAAQMSLLEKDEIISSLRSKMEQQMEEFEVKMTGLNDQLTHAESEMVANKEKANELENELTDVKASYVHNKSILDAALQASQVARNKAEDDLHVMTQKVSLLTTHLQALQQEILQTRSVVTQQDLAHEAWQGKENDLVQELEQAKQAYLEAQSLVNELREQVELERVSGEDKLHELSRLSLEQQDRLTSLEVALSESKGLLENAQEREKLLSEKLEDSQRTGEELAGCAEKLNEKVRSLKMQLSAVEEEKTSLTFTLSQQQGQLEEAQQSLQQLQGQLHEMEEERSRLADQVQMLQQSGDAGMQELQAQVLALQESSRMAEQGLEMVQAEKLAARDELVQLQQQVEEAAERELSLQEQLLVLEEGKLQLEKTASELSEQVNMLQSQLSGAEEREQSLQEQLSQLQQGSDDLKASFSERELSLQEQMLALEENKMQLERTVEEREESCRSLEASLRMAEDSVQEMNKAIEAMQLEVQTLQDRNESAQSQLSAAEEEKTSLTFTLSQQQGQLEEAQQSLQQLQGQLHEMEEERSRLADQVQMLQQSGDAGMQELQAQVLALQESSRMAEQGLEMVQAEKLAARDELVQLQQQVEEAAERELSLQEQLLVLEEGKLQLEKTASELSEQVNMLQSQLSGAEEREQSLQEQLSQLQQESDDLKAGLQSQQCQQVTSLGRLAELELSQETLDQARRELQVQLEAMVGQLRAVESDYSKAMNENDDLKTRLVAAEQGLAQFTQQTNCLLDTEGAMKKRCSQLQTENDLLRGEKDSLSAKIKAIETSLARSEYQASSQLEKLAQQLQESEKKVKTLQEELSAMRLQADGLKAAEQTIAMLRDEAKSLKEEHGRLLQSFDDLQDNYEEQKSRLDGLEGVDPERVVALEGELTALKEDLKEYSQRYAQTQSDYAKLQEELEGTIAERDEAMREIEGTADRLQELTQALEEAEVQLEEMEGQKSALEAQVSEVERLYEDCQHSLLAAEEEREEAKKLLLRASEEVASLKDKLLYHDKEASREQEAIMEAAEMQMDGLRAQIAHLEQVVAAERKEKSALVQAEEQLLIRVDKLMKALQEKEHEAGPKIDPAQVEKVQKLLLQKEQEILSLQRSLDSSTEEVLSLQATLREKEARIVHLDASKLTKDQMEKIKAIKEERNKYLEGYKGMKKQLASLKQAYDSLKQSSEAQAAGPSQEFHISDLKFQIAELNGQLERSGEVTALLKEKLKECSAQLEDYEKERDAVLAILEKHGIDTRGLQINDFSTATSTAGVAGVVQDLGEAVALLAQTIIDRQSSSAVKSKALSEELAATQAQLQTLLLEGAETAAAKAALEKRIESLKQNLRSLREENAEQAAQLNHLLTEKKTLSEQLVDAQRKALTNGEATSSEVQVLEEENLELMRENKDLRVELSKVRSQLSAASVPAPAALPAINTSTSVSVSGSVTNSSAVVPPSAHKVGQKRAFGTELDANAPAQPSPAPSKMSKLSSTPAAAAGEENAVPAAVAGVAKAVPRRVKAHAVSAAPAETPECTQS